MLTSHLSLAKRVMFLKGSSGNTILRGWMCRTAACGSAAGETAYLVNSCLVESPPRPSVCRPEITPREAQFQSGYDLAQNQGSCEARGAWWMWVFPSTFIILTILCINLLGDGLRDAFDPRSGRNL